MSAGTLVVDRAPLDPRTICDEAFLMKRCDDGALRAEATVRAHGVVTKVTCPVPATDRVTVFQASQRLLAIAREASDTYAKLHAVLPAKPLVVELGREVPL